MREPPSPRLTDFTNVDLTVAKMGAGGFGLVFMGPNRLSDGQWFALKTLRPELLALRPNLRDLFLQECLTWVGLWPHANLVTAHIATLIDGRLYLELDYAEHGSLREVLSLDQPFTWRLRWVQMIAAGLVALHTPDPEFLRPFPLVHRDLKPENILVDAPGFAMITDFGLAAAIGEALAQSPDALAAFALVEQLADQAAQAEQAAAREQASQAPQATRALRTARFHTRALGQMNPTGETQSAGATDATRVGIAGLGGVGTIAYMPPEQWVDGGVVGTPADLYAFGLILSELLAGRHGLVDLETDLDEDGWYQLHLSGTPRPLRTSPAEGASRLPIEVEQLYQALLAKRPEDRPTAGQALAVLQQAAQQLGEDPYSPPDGYPRTEEHRLVTWHAWAVTCARFGRFEEALAHNKRALALAPREFHPLNTQGNIVGDLGLKARQAGRAEEGTQLLEEALGWYDQAIAAATTDVERAVVLSMKASRLGDLGRYAEVDAAYAEALAIEPEDGVTWRNRAIDMLSWARSEATAGRREEAVRLYTLAEGYTQETARWKPDDARVASLLATIQRERARLGI